MSKRRSERPATATGSDEAFGAEVLALLQPLYATALRLSRSKPDAEDLVQDTVVKALRFSDSFARGSNLKAWLFTILHNTWRNARRGAGRNPVEADSELMELTDARGGGGVRSETPEAILLRSTLDADVQAALDDLPEIFREAVWLRDVDEFSYAQIAEVLGIPIGTVMSRISRARRILFSNLSTRDGATVPAARHRRASGDHG